jgi:LuxR family maltose regulon positive regulatory protein
LLTAPAGYGKTTLLAQWIAVTHPNPAWVSLDHGDNDWEQFFHYLLAAWSHAHPQVDKQPVSILLKSRAPEHTAVQTAFVNAAIEVQSEVIFVLDDFHFITNQSIHQSVDFLIDHAPSNLHFILAARRQPPLQLAKYRAVGKLQEWGVNALRLDLNQQLAFLENTLSEHAQIKNWQDRLAPLEGWPAGLQLVLAAISSGQLDPTDLEVTGNQRYMAEYLQVEILDKLSEADQAFLLDTGFLEKLDESLCQAVTGQPGGGDRLERLMQSGLLVHPLDAHRQAYRYHPLLADFLKAASQERDLDKYNDLLCRASKWYCQQGYAQRAFELAMAAKDMELAMAVLDQYFITMLLGGRFGVVQRWLNMLPNDWKRRHPLPWLVQAGILMFQGKFQRCREQLDRVDALALRLENQVERYQARTTAMRCNLACFQNDLEQARKLADLALKKLALDDLDFRAGIFGAIGDTYRRNGRWEEAYAAYSNLLQFDRAPTFTVQKVHVYGALADLEMLQGRLRRADAYWQHAADALDEPDAWGGHPLPLAGWVFIRQGELAYERNQLALAHRYLEKGRARIELGQDVQSSIAAALLEARLSWVEGNHSDAEKLLQQSSTWIRDSAYPGYAQRWRRLQLLIWASNEDFQSIQDWLDTLPGMGSATDELEIHLTQLNQALAVGLVGDRDAIEGWYQDSHDLLAGADEHELSGLKIEIMALQAVALHRLGFEKEALHTLNTALRLGEPEGFCRLFVDLGPQMADLLAKAWDQRIQPNYCRQLLETCKQASPFGVPPMPGLPEPLTSRELDVVSLMAMGYTNREIAEQLVIAPGTVKKHAANIYNKMGVNNRTQAAALAKDLGLIS